MGYMLIRFAQAIGMLLVVSLSTFALLTLSPGDFFEEMKLDPQVSQTTIVRLRTQYGLDLPLPIRYSRWLMFAVHGDLGYSLAYGSPVAPLLLTRARNTLLLTGSAMFLVWLNALLLGICCAEWPGSLLDRACLLGTSTLLVIPELLLGLCVLTFTARTGWFPVGGMASLGIETLSPWKRAEDLIEHLCMPALVLTLGSLPTLLRHVRTAMLEVLNSPPICAARGHGISRRRILFRHALPLAINPLTSLLGLSLGSLLSISLLTEVIMGWPGLGPLLLEAVLAKDIYVVVGGIMLSTLFLVIGNAAVDIVLYAFDSRVHSRRLKCSA